MTENIQKIQNIMFWDPQKTFVIFDMFFYYFLLTFGVILGSSRSDRFVLFWCFKLEVPPDRPKDPFLEDRAPILIRKCIKNCARR